ncbi:hypothetical protein [Williamsia sp.]|uniref:hypothetical protein n=1 Tax=Williamsia sp. TaxID=1872085 RepID=UPI002F95AD2A
MDPVIEYVFGVGDGSTTTWTSPADTALGGGVADAIRLDFDGDGKVDDVLWDENGDGRADLCGLDLDDDGSPEKWFSDNGSGVWGRSEADPRAESPHTPQSADGHLVWTSLDGTSQTATASADVEGTRAMIDFTGDGEAGDLLYDRDSDGHGEIVVVRSGGRVYFDTDGDQRFDQVLIDHDLDGTADDVAVPGEPGFGL